MKIPSSNLGRTCCVQKLFLTLRTIFVHNMFSPMFCKKRASDKDLPVLVVLLTGQLKPARTVLTYLHRTVPPSMGLSIWCGLVCTGLEWARSLAQTSARIGRRPASPPVAVFPCTGIQWVQWVCTYGTSAHSRESLMEKIYYSETPEVGGREGACAPPSFRISVNPIWTKGGRLCPPYYYWPPIFLDNAASLVLLVYRECRYMGHHILHSLILRLLALHMWIVNPLILRPRALFYRRRLHPQIQIPNACPAYVSM
jgi:hypothetical protein